MATIYLTKGYESLLNSPAAGIPGALRAAEKLLRGEAQSAVSISSEMQAMIADWDGVGVIADYHRDTGAWVFIALHNLNLGLPVGGCRIKPYSQPLDGLRDAMLLAEGMTYKWAVLGSSCGGGKAVLALPGRLTATARTSLLLSFGRLLEKLGGLFCTGCDFGMSSSDLAVLAKASRYVHGFDAGTGRLVDSGMYTALGVKAGMSAALSNRTGDGNFSGRRVLVQGMGQVGSPLARLLASEGASLLISDTDEARAKRLADELGGEMVESSRVYTTACEIYAPCALGGTLNRQTVARLKCHVVAGAANNQLESDCVADQMHERAILYAPDFVVNAGGAIALPLFHSGTEEDKVRGKVIEIASTLAQILTEAAKVNESPFHVARRRAQCTLTRSSAVLDSHAAVEGKA